MERINILQIKRDVRKKFKVGEVATKEQLSEWILFDTDGYVEDYDINGEINTEKWNRDWTMGIEKVEVKTLIEKVMEHLGVKEGDEFDISESSLNPYRFVNGELLDRNNNICYEELGDIICEKVIVDTKIRTKKEIKELEKKIEELKKQL